jgi:two-component system LytT family response regulator
MIKALIVDDEAKARTSLHKLLKRYCQDVKVVATAESVEEAFEHIQQFQPQLVFLDIEMPEENGFQLLEKFKNPNFEIIFTTAYADYALKVN